MKLFKVDNLCFIFLCIFRPAPFTFYTTMSEKRAAEGAPEIAEKKAKHAEDEEENVAEEEDIEEEENEEEGDEEEDVEGVSFYYNLKNMLSQHQRL